MTWGGAELPLPRPDQGGPWARPLPRPEEMLAELTRGILELDVPRWIFEAQETGRRPGRLGDLLVERGLATLQANTAALLEARLESVPALPIEDVELWYLAHDLCLAEAYLRRNRATLPIDPLARGLHGRLIQAADYTRDGRPPARPGRQVHEKNQDFFLPDLPGRETRDAVEELWYRAKEPASLAVPPGSRPAHFEAVLTWATRFALEYYALVTIEGMRPVYFYEDPTGPGGQVSREAATKQGGQLRRRYWLLVPEALLPDGPLSLEVTFRPWSWDEEQGYEHVIMQAYGWTRDAAPGGR